MEWLLVAVCGFLWAIYAALKKCLAELKNINQRAEITNGLMVSFVDKAGDLDARTHEVGQQLANIEMATRAFYDQLTRSQSRY